MKYAKLKSACIWCCTIIGSYVVAFALSPADPTSVWLYFPLILAVSVFLLHRMHVLTWKMPRQFSLRNLLGAYVVAALILAYLSPYFQSEKVRSSSDNVVSFPNESLAGRFRCTELMYSMSPRLTVYVEPLPETRETAPETRSVATRIEVRGKVAWWDRWSATGEQSFPPYSREEFIARLESEINRALDAESAAKVETVTVPGL
jgi:hypothetical protein